ncbi:hypothetical protein E0H73_24075 [Kribbella pittospori]|uniref:Uncharacterized protein n=1 Tax=Kribbella pittospori TaxID=722689 RepID=A0A4R0KHT2_9ACTN|nr:hypothetical protein [Kribbella pittospori]TCC59699.1 hypothetical protein E0H73_24075 [Kribbella pittospori]
MITRTTSDPAAFKKLVFPFLQRDPVLNSALLTGTADREDAVQLFAELYSARTGGFQPVQDFVGHAFRRAAGVRGVS